VASTQVLKLRIRSVKNTKQVTKAMQLVAASKMRRAQETTKASAPYAAAAKELLTNLSHHTSSVGHPFFASRIVKSRLIIVIASDKGLAGSYNSGVIKVYTEQLKSDVKNGIKNQSITIGRKVAQFASRVKDIEVVGSFESLPDQPEGDEFQTILDMARNKFISGEVDAVDLIFTEFINSIRQEVKILRILPAGFESTDYEDTLIESVYEPSVSEVLDGVAQRLVDAQIFQALLEARASEHSMRMLAMKNASDNATDLIDDLTLAMNKARQGAITQELAEISGGVEALND
jgi:F-type H+-transporting ATPase subunit gamma